MYCESKLTFRFKMSQRLSLQLVSHFLLKRSASYFWGKSNATWGHEDWTLLEHCNKLTLNHGWSRISETDGRCSGLGDNILRTKSLAVDDIDFHSGVSNCEMGH